ncbi:hypothetical protein ACEV6Q_04275 [Enterobacter ludwigii]|uniref:hypothetical protein n=1 Tax=Enterobacter ludwigii TaxID=299767 RepID=UPI003BEF0C3A
MLSKIFSMPKHSLEERVEELEIELSKHKKALYELNEIISEIKFTQKVINKSVENLSNGSVTPSATPASKQTNPPPTEYTSRRVEYVDKQCRKETSSIRIKLGTLDERINTLNGHIKNNEENICKIATLVKQQEDQLLSIPGNTRLGIWDDVATPLVANKNAHKQRSDTLYKPFSTKRPSTPRKPTKYENIKTSDGTSGLLNTSTGEFYPAPPPSNRGAYGGFSTFEGCITEQNSNKDFNEEDSEIDYDDSEWN